VGQGINGFFFEKSMHLFFYLQGGVILKDNRVSFRATKETKEILDKRNGKKRGAAKFINEAIEFYDKHGDSIRNIEKLLAEIKAVVESRGVASPVDNHVKDDNSVVNRSLKASIERLANYKA
jgi:hypothetical protein